MSLVILSSCGKKEEITTEKTTETTTIVQDTVVKEVPAQEEGTSVKIDKNGVDVNSKDVKIEVK